MILTLQLSFIMTSVLYSLANNPAIAIVLPLAHVVSLVVGETTCSLFVDPIAAHVKKLPLLTTAVLLLQMLECAVVENQYAAKQAM
mmetsp:Transcript_42820/g.76998  ORF Transcript_42820/g.76998 Transcript_42820/m.76998 type:complete len:86 (-) Transcript_42820:23-280(-)